MSIRKLPSRLQKGSQGDPPRKTTINDVIQITANVGVIASIDDIPVQGWKLAVNNYPSFHTAWEASKTTNFRRDFVVWMDQNVVEPRPAAQAATSPGAQASASPLIAQ